MGKLDEGKSFAKRGPGRPRKELTTGAILHNLGNRFQQNKKKQTNEILNNINNLAGGDQMESGAVTKTTVMENELYLSAEKFPSKRCCFCNLGEFCASVQGAFLRFEAVPKLHDDFVSPIINDVALNKSLETSKDLVPSQDSLKFTLKRTVSSNKCNTVSELEKIGHADEITFENHIESSYFYVHRNCARWAVRGTNLEDTNLLQLEAEKSMSNKCSYCGQYGASISCQTVCNKKFHLPCAEASGCFLVLESYSLYCQDHNNPGNLMCKFLIFLLFYVYVFIYFINQQ